MEKWMFGSQVFLEEFLIYFGHQLKEVLYGVYVLKVEYLEPPHLDPVFEGQPPRHKA